MSTNSMHGNDAFIEKVSYSVWIIDSHCKLEADCFCGKKNFPVDHKLGALQLSTLYNRTVSRLTVDLEKHSYIHWADSVLAIITGINMSESWVADFHEQWPYGAATFSRSYHKQTVFMREYYQLLGSIVLSNECENLCVSFNFFTLCSITHSRGNA